MPGTGYQSSSGARTNHVPDSFGFVDHTTSASENAGRPNSPAASFDRSIRYFWSATHQLEGSVNGSVPLGTPIANTEIYIVDEHMQPLPAGVPGELVIGGQGVGRGYLNQELAQHDDAQREAVLGLVEELMPIADRVARRHGDPTEFDPRRAGR